MSDITKRALRDALGRELKTKTFDKITVRDITEACGVSRMTFYYHFSDIYDLLEYGMRQILCDIDDAHRDATVGEKFVIMLQMIRDNHKTVMELRASRGWPDIEKAVYKIADEVVTSLFSGSRNPERISEREQRFDGAFLKYGIVGSILDWIDDDMREDPGEIVQMLSSFSVGSLDFYSVLDLRQDKITRVSQRSARSAR